MLTKETDGEFDMLLEMRTVEKEKDNKNLLLHSYSEDLDPNSETVPFSSSEPANNGSSPITSTVSSAPLRKSRGEDFLNSENEKSDYDWLLAPLGTPLFPSMETESQKNVTNKNDMLNSRPTALKPRLVNIREESDSENNMASNQHPNLQSGLLNSSDIASNKKPSSKVSAVTASRSATPTARPTLIKSTNPSRSATPTSRVVVTLPSTKAAPPPLRSSTPTKTSARSSTPTASRSSIKKTARSVTPNRCPSKPTAPSVGPTGRSSSTSKFNPRSSSNPRTSRGSSPSVKLRPSKPSEMPNFPSDTARPPSPQRPASASKGRPVAGNAKSASSNGKTRQKSRSPLRRSASNGRSAYGGGKIFPFKQKLRSTDDNEDSPVVMGTKMVERVVNMRKLGPPKQDDHRSSNRDSAGKSCADGSGFGRTLSNKSLDMALRHMDITRSISGKVRPLVTKCSATYNGSSRSTKAEDSSSNGSSKSNAPSAWSNNSIRLDASEIEDYDLCH